MRAFYLAGSIASGKSTVARLLQEYGAVRIDLDEISRMVCTPQSDVLARIAEAFGPDVLDGKTGELRRDVLAGKAFVSKEATKRLEAITHPAIFRELERQLALHEDDEVCIVEVPLLDRALEYEDLVDGILCVVCSRPMRRVRALRRGMSEQDFDRRDAQQVSDEFLRRHASVVFVNDADEGALVTQVSSWWNSIRREL